MSAGSAVPKQPISPGRISIDNYGEFETASILNRFSAGSSRSPRSLEACKREGINPRDLVKRSPESFSVPGLSQRIVVMRYQFFEHKRQRKTPELAVALAEMLKTVKKTREQMIFRLQANRRVRPGTFLTPSHNLRQKNEDTISTAPTTMMNTWAGGARAKLEKQVDGQLTKFLERQDVRNKKVCSRSGITGVANGLHPQAG